MSDQVNLLEEVKAIDRETVGPDIEDDNANELSSLIHKKLNKIHEVFEILLITQNEKTRTKRNACIGILLILICAAGLTLSVIFGIMKKEDCEYVEKMIGDVTQTVKYGESLQIAGFISYLCLENYCSVVKIKENIYCYLSGELQYSYLTLYGPGFNIDNLGRPMCINKNGTKETISNIIGLFGTSISGAFIIAILVYMYCSYRVDITNTILMHFKNGDYQQMIETFDKYAKLSLKKEKQKNITKRLNTIMN